MEKKNRKEKEKLYNNAGKAVGRKTEIKQKKS